MGIDVNNFYNNPLIIQRAILSEYENRLNGEEYIADPKNAFCFLIEAFSTITAANAFNQENRYMNALYSKRAKNSEDLYHHMSDNDFIGLFSLPGSIDIEMILDKDYLVRNSVKVEGTDYKLVEIPVDTIFYIGNYIFGIYYPIQIMINEITDSVTIIYGTDTINPLHILNSNSINKKDSYFAGINFLSLEFPIYQFEKNSIIEIIQSSFGFRKQYTYQNQIYSVRVFNYINGVWAELDYSLSSISYDPNRPTVILKIIPEDSIVEVVIPQIYFTNGKVGNKIKIEIYNTLGEMDVAVNNINSELILANYNFTAESTRLVYSNVLQNIPTSQINILSEKIIGGSNGYDFDTLKERIIYGSSDNNIPITNMDLLNFFSDRGFILKKYLDNLTNRVFYAYKLLTDINSKNIFGVNTLFSIHVDNIKDSDQYSSILFSEDTITILPNTVYKYDNDTNIAVILKDNELTGVDNLLTESINITKLNNDTYLKGLYHISIINGTKPYAESYDLISCSSGNIQFIKENTRIATQVNVISSAIKYYTINNGLNLTNIEKDSGGFYFYIGLQKSKDLLEITEDNFLVYLTLTTVTGYSIGLVGEFLSMDGEVYLYKFNIQSSLILKDNTISITNVDSESPNTVHILNLLSTGILSYHVRKEIFPSNQNDLYINNFILSNKEKYLSISCQSIDITFGVCLKDKVRNSLGVNWSSYEYEKYTEDVYLTYQEDVYLKDDNGILVYTIEGDEVALTKIHNKGDRVKDRFGEDILLHNVDDIIRYEDGSPMVKNTRVIIYNIEGFMFDIRQFVSNSTFNIDTCNILNDYYSSLSDMQEVIPNTDCFFRVIDIIGNNSFKLDNKNNITLSLALLFKLKCYISSNTYEKEDLNILTKNIIDIIKLHIEKDLISFVDIVSEIKTKLSDFIINIDIGGINNNSSLQTLVNPNSNKKPSIYRELKRLEDGSITFDDTIDIEYITID